MNKTRFHTKLALSALSIMFAISCGSVRPRIEPVTDQISRAETLISQGEYKKSLDLLRATYAAYRSPEVGRKYAESGNQIGDRADYAFHVKNFAKAGSIYKMLIDSRIAEQDFAASLEFDAEYLKIQMKECSDALTELGLVKYREEKLEEAIAIWRKVLTFDDDNRPIIKAIETANSQLQKLKNIDKLGRH